MSSLMFKLVSIYFIFISTELIAGPRESSVGERAHFCDFQKSKPCSLAGAYLSDPSLNDSDYFNVNLKSISNETIAKIEKVIEGQIGFLSKEILSPVLKLPNTQKLRCLAEGYVTFLTLASIQDQFTEAPGQSACPFASRAEIVTVLQALEERRSGDYQFVEAIIKLVKDEYNGDSEKQLIEIFKAVKTQLIIYLKRKNVRSDFIKLVESSRVQFDVCPGIKSWERLELASKNVVYICHAFTWSKNSKALAIWTIAHEMGHIFDACDLARSGKMKFNTSTPSLNVALKNHPLRSLYLKAQAELVDSTDWKQGMEICSHRNLSESFADIVAGEIAPPVLSKWFISRNMPEGALTQKLLFSIGRRVCKSHQFPPEDLFPEYARHPMGNSRMRYFLKLPEIRAKLQCEF